MARRRKKGKTGRFLLAAVVIGGGALWLWKSGKWQQFYEYVLPVNGNGGGGDIPDENIDSNGTIAATALAALLAWLQSRSDPNAPDPALDPVEPLDPPAIPLDPPDPTSPTTPPVAPPVDEPWTFNLPDWLAGVPAGGAALTLAETLELAAQAAVPLIIGTSDFVADLVHDVNLAIPGANTGLEKGNITVFDERGQPVIVTPAGTCFDLMGRPRACPASVTGISQPVLDYIGAA